MDQDLRDLTIQIQDLIRTMRSTSGTGATTPRDTGTEVVRSVDKMVVALAKLAVTLDGSKKTKTAEEEAIKKFTKSVDKSTEEINEEIAARVRSAKGITKEQEERDKATKAAAEAAAEEAKNRKDRETAARNELTGRAREVSSRIKSGGLLDASIFRNKESILELGNTLNSTGATAGALKGAFFDMAGASSKNQILLQFFSAGLKGATKSLQGFTTSLLDGQRGAQVSAKALTDLITPVTSLASSIGSVIQTIGGIALFVPGFQLLGVGALAAGTALKGVAGAADLYAKFNERAAKQLDTQLKSYNELSQAGIGLTSGLEGTLGLMQTLGMTTAEADKFNDLLAKNNKQLALMSGTAATGAKRFADVAGGLYKSDIGRSFEMMGITADEQREAAILYMSIQARTGQLQLKNTQQLVQESAKFVEELDLAAQLTGTTRKEQQEAREAAMAEVRFRAALIDAERRGDKAETARLQTAQRMAAIAKGLGDERGFTGILQAAAGGGALTTPEAVAAEMTYGVNEALSKPNATDEQLLAMMSKNADASLQSLAGVNKMVGGIDVLQTNIIGMDNSVRRQAMLAEEAKKAGFTGPDAITKYLEEEGKKRKAPGGDIALMIDAGRAQQAAALVMEKGISKLNIAADINKKASETFADAVKQFKGITGEVPGGTPLYKGTKGVPLPGASNAPSEATGASGGSAAVGGGSGSSELDFGGALETAPTPAKPVEKAKAPAVPTANDKAVAQAKEQRVNAEKQVTELQKQRELLEKEKGRSSEEAKQARIDEYKARKEAERARAKELTAQRRQGFSKVFTPGVSQTGAMPENYTLNGKPISKKEHDEIANRREMQRNIRKRDEAANSVQGPKQVSALDYIKFTGGTGDQTHFNQLDPAVATAFANMARDYNQMFPGQLLQINSAFRSPEEQAGVESGNNPKAAPGKSLHQQGRAIDIQSAQVQQLAQAGLLNQYGFKTLANDPPHIYMKDGGIAHGPTDGYPATLHGTEAVIPLKNGSVPVMMPSLDQMVSATQAVNQQVQTLKDELAGMMREIATALSNNNTAGAQERMIQLLENIARSQNQTATASKRLASVAIN